MFLCSIQYPFKENATNLLNAVFEKKSVGDMDTFRLSKTEEKTFEICCWFSSNFIEKQTV